MEKQLFIKKAIVNTQKTSTDTGGKNTMMIISTLPTVISFG